MKFTKTTGSFLFISLICVTACFKISGTTNSANQDATPLPTNSESAAGSAADTSPTPASASDDPRTIRDFFMLLPEKYFVLEGCERSKDEDCRKAKQDYLKAFTEVEDIANGYFKGGCDGAQSCLEMTIFKRPDNTYLVALATESEMMIDQYFLDYRSGQWTDVGAQTIPQYSKKNIYELPRQGTTIKVFAKKVTEKGDDYEIAEKGAKLYDLIWKDGKFSIKK